MLRPILAAGIVIVLLFTAYEMSGWRTGRTMLTPAQKPLRIASAVVMITLLAMIVAGDDWLRGFGPLAVMVYWMVCFALGIGLVMLLLFDVRELLKGYREMRHRVFMDSMTVKDDERDTE